MNDSTHCLMDTRRALVRARPLNGLDYVEVGDPGGHAGGSAEDQHYLSVFFLGRLRTEGSGEKGEWRISPAHFRITGGRRIKDIRVVEAWVFRPQAEDEDDMAVLRVEEPGGLNAGVGDFSCYTLEIVDAPEGAEPTHESKQKDKCRRCQHGDQPLTDLRGLCDQRYRCVGFSFKANCPSTLDCAAEHPCTEPRTPPPGINYLAKDYHGFRELILDRLSLTLPDWKERHTPDVGIAVAEIMAYTADRLSYYQDAVAQEAYLETARRRISVRRHARLVDYLLHEGCNARAWVCCTPDEPKTLLPESFDLQTRTPDDGAKPLIFEPVPRKRRPLLERGEFFDLRTFVWQVLHGGAEKIKARLSPGLLRQLRRHQDKDAETPLPEPLAARLLSELNERVLLDRTYAAESVPAGDLAEIARVNRAAFDGAQTEHCVAFRGLYLNPAHDTLHFYTWQTKDCCLEAGALECTLRDAWIAAAVPGTDDSPSAKQQQCALPPAKDSAPPKARALRLRPGDVLIFEEVTGPQTGNAADADKSRRHAVRLTAVEPDVDRLTDTPVLRVRWAAEDALPFSFCLSRMGPPPDCAWLDAISVARGNVILADHGQTLDYEPLGDVAREDPDYHCRCVGVLDEISVRPRPFTPDLDAPGLTFAVPLESPAPAAKSLEQKPWLAVPALAVESLPPVPDGSAPALTWSEFTVPNTLDPARTRVWNLLCAATQRAHARGDDPAATRAAIHQCLSRALRPWTPVPDLVQSGAEDRHFVVEMDDERHGHLRFGRDGLGLTPEAGESFRCRYRTGNGPGGNTGMDTITVFHAKQGTLGNFTVRNPLPARGGTAPESLTDAKRNAPFVFRLRQFRAITADDYARLAEKNPRVQRAGAELRWTGSRQCVRVAIDALGTSDAPASLITEVRDDLLKYRRIGHDLEVIPAHYAAVFLVLDICAHHWALRGDVEAAVRDALTAGFRRDGVAGLFHPDNITFGEPVRISRVIAAVQPLPGVMSVRVNTLHRVGGQPCGELENGFLPVGPLEVARLDNDPDFPEHGTFTLNINGGR